MDTALYIFNSVCYALSHCIIASTLFDERRPLRYALCFLTLMASQHPTLQSGHVVTLINLVIYTACFYQRGQFRQTLYNSVATVSIGVGGILFISSLFMWAFPQAYGGTAFNLYMGGMCIAASLAWCVWRSSNPSQIVSEKGKATIIALQAVLLAYYLFILPNYAIANVRKMGFILSTAILLLLAVVCGIKQIYRAESAKQVNDMQKGFRWLLYQITSSIRNGLQRNRYNPAKYPGLKNIKPLTVQTDLYALLEEAKQTCTKCKITVQGDILIPQPYIMPFMSLYRVFFETALASKPPFIVFDLQANERGFIRLTLRNTMIENTMGFDQKPSIQKPLFTLPHTSFEQRLAKTKSGQSLLIQGITLDFSGFERTASDEE